MTKEDATTSSRNIEMEKSSEVKSPQLKKSKARKAKSKGKTKTKTKTKSKGKKLSKDDKQLLKRISQAVAYCAHLDLVTLEDLERDCKNMTSATLAETKKVFRKMKSNEKLLATSEGRHAEAWAAGPTAFKDKTAKFLFEGMKKPNDTADLKAFIETCRNSVNIKSKKKGPTEKQIAEEKRLRKYRDLDWTDRTQMYTTWPIFVQERIRLERSKKLTQEVNIEYFSMNLPLTRDYLILDSELKIGTRQRLALIGPPGSGKSVLFHAMANAEIKEFPIHLHVHHMEELEVSADAGTLLSTVVEMDQYLLALRRNKAELEARIEGKDGHEAPSDEAKAAMQSNLAIVETKLRQRGHEDAEERAAKTLRVLGFDDTAQQKSINSLSGGLRMRVALCGAFFVKADILLLDEPTNHLDFPSLLWLEAEMRSYPKSLVVVCHDREILNNIATGVIQITEEKQLKYWRMGFEQYEKERWKAEKKMAKSVDKFLARNLRVDPSSESYLEVKRKREWMARYNKMMVLRAGQFTFPPPTDIAPDNHQLGQDLELKDISVIKVDNVTFSYDAETLPFIFKSPISIDIKMSTRMGVQGPNGAGKSTFLKLLTGRLQPVTGTITKNKNATVGYFSQHHSAEMDLNTTPMDFMTNEFPDEAKARCRQHLGKVGVLGDLADSRMISLSQGLRSCVLFAKITMHCPSLLIMDEPTNFLDLETVDALIGAANKFQGALLLVSHSRLFLKKCATHYLSIVPGQFNVYDNLKKCERATYTFIASLENGDKIRIGEGNLATSAGSNSIESIEEKKNPTQKSEAASDGVLCISSKPDPTPISTKPDPKPKTAAVSKVSEPKPANGHGNPRGHGHGQSTAKWTPNGHGGGHQNNGQNNGQNRGHGKGHGKGGGKGHGHGQNQNRGHGHGHGRNRGHGGHGHGHGNRGGHGKGHGKGGGGKGHGHGQSQNQNQNRGHGHGQNKAKWTPNGHGGHQSNGQNNGKGHGHGHGRNRGHGGHGGHGHGHGHGNRGGRGHGHGRGSGGGMRGGGMRGR